MANGGPLSFFFADAKPEDPRSYASLQTRRRIAEQLAGKRMGFPKTIGEGLTYLGESLAERRMLDDLDRREQAEGSARANYSRGAAARIGRCSTGGGTSTSRRRHRCCACGGR